MNDKPDDEGVPNVHVAIARVAADIGHIAKDQRVESGPARFNFRGIDDVLDTIHEPLCRHGVSVVPVDFHVVEQSERVTSKGTAQFHLLAKVTFHILGPAGDHVVAAALAEALDTSDKAASKAMSMAYKYVAFQVFSIPVRGALDESDRESLERGTAQAGPNVTLEDVHARLMAAAEQVGTDMDSLTGKFRQSKGGITMEQFYALPLNEVYPFSQQVAQYVARQNSQSGPAASGAPNN